MDDHRQKYVEINKDCFWNELQNYCVESTEKKLVCLQIDCKHLQCVNFQQSSKPISFSLFDVPNQNL